MNADHIDGVVRTEVSFGNKQKPMRVYLGRIGISDTLYVDRVGNFFIRQPTGNGHRDAGTPYDSENRPFHCLAWTGTREGKQVTSNFNAYNGGLVTEAIKRAGAAQKAYAPLSRTN
jgi:hypothetical protein